MEKLSGFPLHLHENNLLDYKQFEEYKDSNNYNAFNEIAKEKILSEKELVFQAFLFTNESVIDLTYLDTKEIELNQDFEFNKNNLLIPIKINKNTLNVIVFNPFDKEVLVKKLNTKFDFEKIRIFISTKKDLLNLNEKLEVSKNNEVLNKDKEITSVNNNIEKQKNKEEINKEKTEFIKKEEKKVSEEELKNITIQNFLKQVLTGAINSNANEIHFEPYDRSYRVRFKQSNELYTSYNQPKEIGEDVAKKIKEMAGLDVDSKKYQTGNITLKINSSRSVDFKVSVCPLYANEKIVFNVKHIDSDKLSFNYLGLETEEVIKVNKSLEKKEGVFIFNGMKQSGRKHSMYTVLKSLDSNRLNIYTIENNVGFYLDGINQIKVNKDFTYEDAIEVVSSQNADVIMIDIVSDVDILKKLFQIAKSGRMILFKTNFKNNKEVMQYLLQSGISLLDIYTSLKMIISQALLKENCHDCEVEDHGLSPVLLKEFGFNKTEVEEFNKIWKPKKSTGCFECEDQGVKGLIAIFDVFVITKEMRQLILEGQLKTFVDMINSIDEKVLFNKAKSKFKDGVISFEQLKEIYY